VKDKKMPKVTASVSTEPKIQPCEAAIKQSVGRITCYWEDSHIEISVSDIKSSGPDIEGVYSVYHRNGEKEPSKWITGVKMNFVTAGARKTLAGDLDNASKRFAQTVPYDWNSIVEQLARTVVDSERRHNDFSLVDLDAYDYNVICHKDDYLIDPIVHRNAASMLYAYGGSCKGFLGTLMGLMVQSGTSMLGWTVNKAEPVLYLDWEDTAEEYMSRCRRLRDGCNLPSDIRFMPRMGMHTTLLSALPEVAERIAETGSKFIIVDALEGAVAGQLNDADSPGNFFNKLKQIKDVTWLILHHRTKSQKGDPADKKSLMGSVFWINLPRATHMLHAEKNVALPRTMDIDILNDKNNHDETQPMKNLRIQWDGRYGPIIVKEMTREQEQSERVSRVAADEEETVQKMVALMGCEWMTAQQVCQLMGIDDKKERASITNKLKRVTKVFEQCRNPNRSNGVMFGVKGIVKSTQSAMNESEEEVGND
jgi:hypothetical protein